MEAGRRANLQHKRNRDFSDRRESSHSSHLGSCLSICSGRKLSMCTDRFVGSMEL